VVLNNRIVTGIVLGSAFSQLLKIDQRLALAPSPLTASPPSQRLFQVKSPPNAAHYTPLQCLKLTEMSKVVATVTKVCDPYRFNPPH